MTMLTGQKLRAIRSLRGITQSELAHQCGLSQSAIAQFEAGNRDMRASSILKICEALRVKVIYKMEDTELTGP